LAERPSFESFLILLCFPLGNVEVSGLRAHSFVVEACPDILLCAYGLPACVLLVRAEDQSSIVQFFF